MGIYDELMKVDNEGDANNKPAALGIGQSKKQKATKQIDGPMAPTHHGPMAPTPHETIRKAVRSVGKETTNLRLSGEEKEAVQDLVYILKKRGFRTSENEIARIGINQLLGDYAENGDDSVLVQVLERLNS